MDKVIATSVHPRLTASVSPDGRVLASCAGDVIYLWELPTLQPLTPHALLGNAGEVTALAFSPDGKTLASASYEGTVKFWNVATWKEMTTLRAHISVIFALAFSPEPASRYLATGSFDDTIKLWSAPSFAETDAATRVDGSDRAP
jgi:WD40 repeat protein